jgi:predicted ester cyclase
MTVEENKTLIRRIVEEALNQGRIAIADEYFDPDYIVHIPSRTDLPRGPGAFKQTIGMWRSAFSDWHMTIEDLVGERDLVANRFTTTGTHTGPLFGFPATSRKMTVRGQELHRLANGKVVESWICDDIPSILSQLGLMMRADPAATMGRP